MTAKLTVPPLVPSAEERLGAVNFNDRDDFMRAATEVLLAHRDSAAAMLDAVIALLRKPDEALYEAIRLSPSYAHALRALADELERRKP